MQTSMTRYADSPTMRATAAKGICWASIRIIASNISVKPARRPANSGSTMRADPSGSFTRGVRNAQMALVLEKVQVPIVLGHGVMNRMQAGKPGHAEAGALTAKSNNTVSSLASASNSTDLTDLTDHGAL